MSKNLHNFIEESKKMKMTSAEKSRVHAYLVSYIGKTDNLIPSPYSFMGIVRKSRIGLAFAMILLFVTAGTSYAADQALPGDTLYGVKVNLNEEVENLVTFGPSAKAELALSRAQKRLEEAETLSVQGKLNSNTQAIILTNFTRHADDVKANVAELTRADNTVGAADVSSELESSVKAHTQILKLVSKKTANQTALVNSLVSQVVSQVDTDDNASSTASSTASTSSIKINFVTLQAKMQEADKSISEVKAMFETTSLPNDILTKVKISINGSDTFFAQGKFLYDQNSGASSTTILLPSAADAIKLFDQAETKAEEAKAIMQIYVDGGSKVNQVLNAISDSSLSASSTIATSTITATSTIKVSSSTSTASTTLSTSTNQKLKVLLKNVN